MKLYQYTMLKQDGEIVELGVCKKKDFKELYLVLDCNMIERIPADYYKGKGYGRCSMYGDEEGRFKETNIRNPHFLVIEDFEGNEWDVVGNIVMEKVAKEAK